MRAMYFASLCAMRTGLDILTQDEGSSIEEIRGHGGFFRGGDTGQRMMAAALDVPVSIPADRRRGRRLGYGRAGRLHAPRRRRASPCPTTSTSASRGASAPPVAPDPAT